METNDDEFIDTLIEQEITSVKWVVYFYGDEEHIQSIAVTSTDGDIRELDARDDREGARIEENLWELSMHSGFSDVTGVFVLDTEARTITRVGEAWAVYHEDESCGPIETESIPPEHYETISL